MKDEEKEETQVSPRQNELLALMLTYLQFSVYYMQDFYVYKSPTYLSGQKGWG